MLLIVPECVDVVLVQSVKVIWLFYQYLVA